jgi:transcriptional regulator GlxA family with amidase domain
MNKTRTLAILLFEDVEVLDFCGPFEVFSVANRLTSRPTLYILTAAQKAPSMTRGGLVVYPHHRLADRPRPDVLLVPGGQGTRKEIHSAALIDWIKQASSQAELVLSVCTGALLLAKAGLLDGLEATTHHGAIDLLRQIAPEDDSSRRPPLRGQRAGGLLAGDRPRDRREPARRRPAARTGHRRQDGEADGVPLTLA